MYTIPPPEATAFPAVASSTYPVYGTEAITSTAQPGNTEDVCQFWHIFLAAALAGGSGVRAVAPLFLLSAAHLSDPKQYPLSPVAHWLGHQSVCIGLGVLLLVEVLADQVPAVDHALHAILTPAHPISGAMVAIAPHYCGGLATRVPMAFMGAFTALSVHAGKAVVRGGSSAISCGILNPCISLFETVATVILLVLCILMPAMAVVGAAVFLILGCFGVKQIRGHLQGPDDQDGDSSEEDERALLRREERRKRKEKKRQRQREVSGMISGQGGPGPAEELEAAE